MSTDWVFLDATDQLRALRAGEISARELLDASLAHTNRLNGQLNAVVVRDLERAYATADAIDARRSRGEQLGLLTGLPMTVKEAFDIEGLPASAGRKSLLNRNAKDALVIERTRSAGAMIWGKTNTPVNSADWQTYNPLYGARTIPGM